MNSKVSLIDVAVGRFFNDHPELVDDFPTNWPEDSWYCLDDYIGGLEMDINLYTFDDADDDRPYRASVYNVIDGETQGDHWIDVNIQPYLEVN